MGLYIKNIVNREIKLTRYEELKNKAEECRRAARRTSGFMQWIWLDKAKQLEELAANLPLTRAAQIIK